MPTDSEFGNLGQEALEALEIGARISCAPSSRLIASAFRRELEAQLPLSDALNRVDLVHTLALSENGVIPRQAAEALIEALQLLGKHPDDFRLDAAAGDLYTNREAWLNGKTKATAWLGTGRARREALTTAYAMTLRNKLLALAKASIHLIRTLSSRSEAYAEALMPDYTYWQQAQPTSFGHYLLGFAYASIRDLQRIRNLYPRLNLSPAGCGSSNGSCLPQARERMAELLGFDGLAVHARDAMWQADVQIELAAVETALLVNLDRLAEDLQIMASDEFGLVELGDAHARASKIMPQKKNPFALTHIRGLANSLIGHLAATAAMGRMPSGQPDSRLALYGTMTQTLESACGAVKLFNEVIESLRFNVARARQRLDAGFCMATDLAEVLVLECGISFRDAHRLVGCVVRESLDVGNFSQLTSEQLAEYAESVLGRRLTLDAETLKLALNAEIGVSCRTQTGGAAAEPMAEMIAECRQIAEEGRVWCGQCDSRLQAAKAALEGSLMPYLKSGSVG